MEQNLKKTLKFALNNLLVKIPKTKKKMEFDLSIPSLPWNIMRLLIGSAHILVNLTDEPQVELLQREPKIYSEKIYTHINVLTHKLGK